MNGYASVGINMDSATPVTVTDNYTMAVTGGNLALGTTGAGSYRLYVNGAAFTTGTWQGSDRRWKKNITTLDGALNKILACEVFDSCGGACLWRWKRTQRRTLV